jgi:allophanate hydrolase subunit 2
VLSLDLSKLAQLMPGGTIQFEAISLEQAHNLLALDEQRFNNSQCELVAK